MNEFKKLAMVMTGLLAVTVTLAGCWVYYPNYPHGTAIIRTAPPPPVTAVAPAATVVTQPQVEPIAGTSIYWTPTLGMDIFYYNNIWYWSDGPNWYRAGAWGGNWIYVAFPPRVFLGIPSHHSAFGVTFRHPHHRHYSSYRRQHYGTHANTKPARTVPFSAATTHARSKGTMDQRKGGAPNPRASQKGHGVRQKPGTQPKRPTWPGFGRPGAKPPRGKPTRPGSTRPDARPPLVQPTRPGSVRPDARPPRGKPTRPGSARPDARSQPKKVTPRDNTRTRRGQFGRGARSRAEAARRAKAAEEERKKKEKKEKKEKK